MKLTIEKIIRSQKEGQYGPYTSVSVLAGGHWHNCTEKNWNAGWQEGQTIEVERQSGGEYKGKETFKILKSMEKPANLDEVLRELKEIKALLTGPKDMPL